MQGSAAEALGLIGDPAAPADRRDALGSSQSGALTNRPGDDEDTRRDTPAGAFRLGVTRLCG